jgi:hypothetical protein
VAAFVRGPNQSTSVTHCARWGSDGLIVDRAISLFFQHTRLIIGFIIMMAFDMCQASCIMHHQHHHHRPHHRHDHHHHQRPPYSQSTNQQWLGGLWRAHETLQSDRADSNDNTREVY